jgi:hypothetical protein
VPVIYANEDGSTLESIDRPDLLAPVSFTLNSRSAGIRVLADCPSDDDNSDHSKCFCIDSENDEASNRPVAQRPLSKSVPSAPVLLLPATVEKSSGRSIATKNRKTSGEQ